MSQAVQGANPAADPSTPAVWHEPRWPATVAVVTVGVLHLALPPSLVVGPRWWLLAAVLILLVPIVLAHQRERHTLNHVFAMVLAIVLTGELVIGVVLLAATLPRHLESPMVLLRSAVVLWVTNVIVFAYWYWRVDAGGPNLRWKRGHPDGAFYFPQFQTGVKDWRPGFVDYLFLAFTTSTAFSPTDTPVLTPWAKLVTMLQAMIALVTTTILVARAINIL